MLVLYIANKNYSSWSLRPWLLMRECGIPFEEKLVRFGHRTERADTPTPSPTGAVPCLVDGPIVVWDSLSIIEYLAEQYGGVWPAGFETRSWARSAAAEMHSGFMALREQMTMNCGLRIRIDDPTPALLRELTRIDELWTSGLERFGGPYLAGDRFTAVDAFFAPLAFRIQTYNPIMSATSLRYAARLLALPSMKEWYAAALSEPWRDRAHEAEARRAGVWVEDLRVGSDTSGVGGASLAIGAPNVLWSIK